MNKKNRTEENFPGSFYRRKKLLHSIPCRGDSAKAGGREIFLCTPSLGPRATFLIS